MKQEIALFFKSNKNILIVVVALLITCLGTGINYAVKSQQYSMDASGYNDYRLSGSGTEQDPYLISSKADLYEFADYVEKYNLIGDDEARAYTLLTCDIDLGGDDWIPIGERTSRCSYTGIFNGGGYTVSNFNIVASDYEYVGFFSALWEYQGIGAEIHNFNISDATLVSNEEHNSVGGLTGVSYSEITNCSVDVDITLNEPVYTVGGLVGMAYGGPVANCETSGSMNVFIAEQSEAVSAENYTYPKYGGVIGTGQEGCEIYSLTNNMALNFALKTLTTEVEQDISVNVGGVMGQVCGAYYYDLVNNADISGVGGVGGVIADCWSSGTVIENCVNNGDIYTICGINSNVGGILGQSFKEGENLILNSANYGDITIDTVQYEGVSRQCWGGGILGIGNVAIENSLSTGDITVTGKLIQYIGGLVGGCQSTIKNSYCTGDISVESTTSIITGGIVGVMQSDIGTAIESCYYSGTIIGSNIIIESSSAVKIGGIVGYNMRTTETTTINNYYNIDNIASYQGTFVTPTEWYGETDEPERYNIETAYNNCGVDTQTLQSGELEGFIAYDASSPSTSGVWIFTAGELPKLYWE